MDSNGQTIRSERTDGTFQDGIVLTLAIPYVQSDFLIRRIDRVIKEETDGPVRGYQFDGGTLYDLASYDASETNPDYRKSRITGGCGSSRPGCCPSQITALVKLAFVPAKYDDDLILIENLDALALAVQSIKMSDAFDSDEAEKLMLRAVHECNLDLRNRLPLDQTQISFKPFGTADLRRNRIGRLI